MSFLQFKEYWQLSQKLPGRRIIWPIIRIKLTGGKTCVTTPKHTSLINPFRVNLEYSHVYAVCSMGQLHICSSFLYITITPIITYVTCSINDSIFKPIQECRLKRQYTFFPSEWQKCKTWKSDKKIGLDYASAQKMCKSDTNTATQSGVAKLFMSIEVMENWLIGW